MQVGEDLGNHRRINDRGDDLQAAAAAWAVLDIDIEHALKPSTPDSCAPVSHARARDRRRARLPAALAPQQPASPPVAGRC